MSLKDFSRDPWVFNSFGLTLRNFFGNFSSVLIFFRRRALEQPIRARNRFGYFPSIPIHRRAKSDAQVPLVLGPSLLPCLRGEIFGELREGRRGRETGRGTEGQRDRGTEGQRERNEQRDRETQGQRDGGPEGEGRIEGQRDGGKEGRESLKPISGESSKNESE
jgi:hypothetical protein